MTRILLIGKNGQVGWELQRTLVTLGEVIALDRHGLNLADPDSIRHAVHEHKPNVIVNAAAYTSVDKAEAESDLAMAVNGTAPGILAEEAKRFNAALIHYSTDYVFDGNKDTPYTEEDVPNPLNTYGKTKLVGEQAIQAVGGPHLIFRTSWVYGARGKNFLLTILRLARERDELSIVNDQFGAPTWSRMIAEATAQVMAQLCQPQGAGWGEGASGIYNLTSGGETSWFGLAKVIIEAIGSREDVKRPKLTPIGTHEYRTPARRPKNSRLDCTRLGARFGICLPAWETGLQLCIVERLEQRAGI